MTTDEASRLDFVEAEKLRKKKRALSAEKRYQEIVRNYQGAAFADDALLRLAQLAQSRKNTTLAIRLFQSILKDYPKADRSDQARGELSILLTKKERYQETAQILSSIRWMNLPSSLRKPVWESAKASFSKTKLPELRVLFLLSVYDAEKRKSRRSRLEIEILGIINALEDPRFLDDLAGSRDGGFPAGFITFRLAKISYFAGDRRNARGWLGALFNRFPGHATTEEATILAENISQSEKVDPKALGLLLPLSGRNQKFGEQVLRGVALAMNIYGGTLSSDIELFIEDSGNTPEEVLSAARNLVHEKNVIAAIGPLFFGQTKAVAQVSQEYDLPIFSLSAAEGVTELGIRMFRNSLTKSEQAHGLAYLLRKILKAKRAAILYPQNSYGHEFKKLFWKEFEKAGGEIRGAEGYDPSKNNFGAAIRRLTGITPWDVRSNEVCKTNKKEKEAALLLKQKKIPSCYPRKSLPPVVDFEYLFVPDSHAVALQVAPLLPYYNVEGVQLLGTNLWNTPELLRRESTHLQGSIFLDGFFMKRQDETMSDFVRRFYAIYGDEPTVLEANAYDTVRLALQVLEKNRPNSREAFSDALENIRNFPGVTGKISIGDDRDARRKLTPLIVNRKEIIELN